MLSSCIHNYIDVLYKNIYIIHNNVSQYKVHEHQKENLLVLFLIYKITFLRISKSYEKTLIVVFKIKHTFHLRE